jgi:diacylglycerol kinase (ATP)
LKRIGIAPELVPTDAAGHATELARKAVAGGADLVLVLGGDGTINEAANGMLYSRVPLGVLPAGTANVLANELGLGNRLERAVERLSRCAPQRIAVGKLCDARGDSRCFLLMGGVGLDATIVTKVSPWLKARAGKLAYWMAGFGEFLKPVKNFDARVQAAGVHGSAGLQEKPGRYGFVLASRVRNYGGDLEIASGSSLLSNDFEVVLFKGSNPLRYAAYMAAVLVKKAQGMPGVDTVRASRVEFSGQAHIQIDGEYAGELPASFEMMPDALTLLMPRDYR